MEDTFDAVMITGKHAMAGGREKGCWRHTILPHPISHHYSSVTAVWLNDTLVGELGLVAAIAGGYGVPVILVTGDYWATLEARDLIPKEEVAAVKRGISYHSANSLHPEDARKLLAEKKVDDYTVLGQVISISDLPLLLGEMRTPSTEEYQRDLGIPPNGLFQRLGPEPCQPEQTTRNYALESLSRFP